MSKINQLIQNHCPAGVEYKKLEDVLTIKNGRDYKQFGDGDVPVYGSGGIMTYINTAVYDKPSVLIPRKGSLDKLYYVDTPFWNVDTIFYTDIDTSLVEPKYIYYYLEGQHLERLNKAGGVPSLTQAVLNKVQLPVPPLEVQREIVRILDNFTSLKAELQAELQARKKQYEYYRDELLKPQEKIPMVTLKEIATSIYRGAGIKRDQITEEGIPCVRYGEIYTTYNTWFDECVSHTKEEYVSSPKYFEHGDILFAITGESVEDIAKSIAYVGHDKCLAGGDIVVMKHQQNPRYLAHVLNTTMIKEQKSKGKVKSKVVHSNVPSIEQIKIPLPSLEVQKRYADVLDNFEQICNDLNIGLPAEIEARQKQYEYYRDALLSFDNSYFVNVERERDEWHSGLIKLWQYVFGYAPVKLKDIATISRGGNFQKKDFVKIGKPCIHYGQMYTHFGIYADKTLTFVNNDVFAKSKTAKPGDIIMAVTSENVEDVCSCTAWLGNEEIAVSGHTAIISHNQNAKYMSYFFHSASFFEQKKQLAHGTKVIEVTPIKLGDIKIMLPTLKEQERIVSILDRFDSLCNDISSGLPAEIETRQKQYEYYRDKLLSF